VSVLLNGEEKCDQKSLTPILPRLPRYAYYKKLDYFSTECIYHPNAYRGYAREYLRELEQIRPSAVIDIIHSGEALRVGGEVKRPEQQKCKRCGYMSSNDLCKACLLLEGLNRGQPSLGIHSSKSRYVREARASDSGKDDESKIGRKIAMYERPGQAKVEITS
jgi:cytoplasmic tRNA 2-thiolation protein 1